MLIIRITCWLSTAAQFYIHLGFDKTDEINSDLCLLFTKLRNRHIEGFWKKRFQSVLPSKNGSIGEITVDLHKVGDRVKRAGAGGGNSSLRSNWTWWSKRRTWRRSLTCSLTLRPRNGGVPLHPAFQAVLLRMNSRHPDLRRMLNYSTQSRLRPLPSSHSTLMLIYLYSTWYPPSLRPPALYCLCSLLGHPQAHI
jgi:hypothetical protein